MSDSYNQDSITQVDRDNTNVDRQGGAGYGANNTADQFDGGANNAGRTTHMERAEGGFNDYGAGEVGRGGSGLGNQDNNFGTSGRTGGMDHNSGPGNSGGFDAGSGAETAGTGYGTNRGNFGTSGGGMDHNSGPGNTGGGFDAGSGAGIGRTGGMDHNSGAGNTGGGFDVGSGAGVGTGTGIGANTNSSSNEYGSQNEYGTGTSSNEYGTGATSDSNHGGKPSMGDRIKGGAEKLVGQVTKNPELVEKGQLRKEGEFAKPDRYDSFTSYQ